MCPWFECSQPVKIRFKGSKAKKGFRRSGTENESDVFLFSCVSQSSL